MPLNETTPSQLPSTQKALPIRRLLGPLRRFLEVESVAGLVLFLCAAAALVIANSPWSLAYSQVWHTPIRLGIGEFTVTRPLEFFINDGLMTLFFFVVGLEIKRELTTGELSEWRKALLPVSGALGGMIFPAAIYLAWRHPGLEHRGWGVPMATDIAFVVGVMALFGSRVPLGLKVFLLALAIADDIGAVLVIAVAYTDDLSVNWLWAAVGAVFGIISMNMIGIRQVRLYFVAGIALWYALLRAHVHPTVAGVVAGLLTPARPLVELGSFRRFVADGMDRLGDDEEVESSKQRALLSEVAWAAQEAVSPLERLQGAWHPIVSFLILPLFALANAGVRIDLHRLTHPVALAIAAGLVVGKPLGIVGFSWLAVRLRIARLPTKVDWGLVVAAGCLGGIGFTMAIFIAGLAFDNDAAPELLAAAKVGVFAGSVASGILGSVLLARFARRNEQLDS